MYAASWSGGKDCCLALYEALQQGYDVPLLLNTISERYQRVRFHGTPAAMLPAQAAAMGRELVQWPTPDETYEEAFLAALRHLQDRGVTGVIFGDIFPEANRDWCRRMCDTVGLEAIHPIFAWDTEAVMARFLEAGFEAVVVSGRPDYFSAAQMGQRLGGAFLEWCRAQPGLDVCGENGEFHTVVVDGPLFVQRLEITEGEPCQVNGHWFLDIRQWEARPKA
jgi:uncharacterized protein (TIGR00290 family)